MLHFLKSYWWLILLIPLGAILNTIKDLNRIKYKRYLLPKQTKPPETDTDVNKNEQKKS